MAYNRPEALNRTLVSWAKADLTGVEFSIHIDGPNPAVEEVARLFTPNVVVQAQNLGSEMHPWHVFHKVFDEDHADYCVLAQDDVEVTTDVLDYFRYCDEQFRERKQVLLASTGGASRCGDVSRYYEVYLGGSQGIFSSTIWATWPDRWRDHLKTYWAESARPRTMGVDIWIDHRVIPISHLLATNTRWGRGKPFAIGTHVSNEVILADHQPKPWAGDVTPPADGRWYTVE